MGKFLADLKTCSYHVKVSLSKTDPQIAPDVVPSVYEKVVNTPDEQVATCEVVTATSV